MNKTVIKKIEIEGEKIENSLKKLKRNTKKRIFSLKTVLFCVLIGIVLSLIMLFVAFVKLSQWYDNNRVVFQQPVIIRPPVVVEARNREVATTSAKIESKPITESYLPIINELYRKIRFIESTAGMNNKDQTATHNYCQSIGEVNEIGYLVDGNRKFCFKDYGEQWDTFKKWWEKRLPNNSVDELLSLWNTGKIQPMSTYSIKYHSL